MRSSAQFRYLCSTFCICALLSVCSASGPFSWLFGATSPCSSPTGGTQQGQWVCVDQSTGLPAPSANCTSPTLANPACCSAGCVDPVSFSAVTCSGSVIGTSKRLSITCSVNVTMPSGKTLSNLDFGRLHGMPTEVSAALFNQTGAVQTTNYSLPVGGNTIQWAHWFNVKTPDGFWPNAGGWFHASFLYLRLDGSIWDSDKPQLILAAGDPTLVGECAMLMCPLGMYSNTQIDCTIQQPMDSPLTNTPMFIDASDIQFSSSSRQLSYGGISHQFFDPTLRLTIVSQKITGTITVSACSSGSNCSECSEQSSEFIVAYAPVSTISTLSCDPNQLMYGDNLRSDWAFCSTTLQTDTPFDTLPLVNANNTALIIRSSVDGAIVTIAGPMVATFSFNNTGYDVQWVLAPPQWDSPKVYTGFANMVAQYIQPDGQVVLSAEANVLVYYPSANVTSIFLACPDTVTVTSADNGDPTACSVLAKVGNTEVFINAQDLNITSNDPNFDLGIAAYDPKVPESRLLWIPAYVYGASGLQHTINVQLLSLSTSATIRAVPPAQPSSSGPSGGVIAGAVIGSLVGATLAGFLIYRFYFKSNSPSNFGISVSTADDTPVEYRAL